MKASEAIVLLFNVVFCLHVGTMCKMCPRRPEEGIDPLELELETNVSAPEGTGNPAQGLPRAASALNS